MWTAEAGKSIRDTNPGVDSLWEFSPVTDNNLMYIYFVYDWTSPMYKISLKEKKTMAAKEAGHPVEPSGQLNRYARKVMNMEIENVNRAIAKFVQLQRDSDQDRALLDSLQNQINEITHTMGEPSKDVKELKDKVAITKILKDLIGQRKDLARLLDLRLTEAEEEAEKEIEKEMSALDRYNVTTQEKLTDVQ